MMRNFVLWSCLIFLLIGSGHSFDETSDCWEVKVWDNSYISKTYMIKNCSVAVYRDGSGVAIEAIDPDWSGRKLFEFTEIRRNKKGELTIESVYSTYDGTIYRILTFIPYRVFLVKFLEKAKKLPSCVKEKFFGCYGLGE